jgi:hypothetical protein
MSTHVEPGPRMPLVASALLAALAENWWTRRRHSRSAVAKCIKQRHATFTSDRPC